MGTWSTGMQQKLSLVRALLPDAEAESDVRGGTTRELRRFRWLSPAGDALVLTDMPGTAEADGQLDALARERGVPVVVDIGVAPGMCHLLAAHGVERLGGAERVRILVGGVPVEERLLGEPDELAVRGVIGTSRIRIEDDRVRFVEPQPHHILSTFYRAADVVLAPSRSESFGLVALEAAACGISVVASAVGGLLSLVDDGFYNNTIFHRVIAGFMIKSDGCRLGIECKSRLLPSL